MVSVVDPDIVADPIESITTQGMRFGQEPSKTDEPQKFRKHTREKTSLSNVVSFVDKFFEADKEGQDAATCAMHSMKSGENYLQFEPASACREVGDSTGKHLRSASKDSIMMVKGAVFESNEKED